MKKQIVAVGNSEVAVKEFRGQRVVTFKDIDTVHERPEGTAKRNFSDNRKRFVEGEDYFILKPGDSEKYDLRTLEIPNRGLIAMTEQGYLMLVKPFTDDLSWKVQRQLVTSYFKKDADGAKRLSATEQLRLQQQAILEVDEKVDAVNEDLQEFKRDMPLLALECQKITWAKNQKVVPLLGGKDAPAYKDNGLRSRVYRDVEGQLRREFGVTTYKAIKRSQCDLAIQIIKDYELPMALEEEIRDMNSQMELFEE